MRPSGTGKALIVSNGYPPVDWAGTETYTANVANELARRGWEVRVVCGGRWSRGNAYWNGVVEDRSGDVSVHRLCLNWAEAPDPNGVLVDSPLVGRYVERLLAEFPADVVHVTSCYNLSVRPILAAKESGRPPVTSPIFACSAALK